MIFPWLYSADDWNDLAQRISVIYTFQRLPSIFTFACKVAMAIAVPTLEEELSLVDVCGQQCMSGAETNLAELLLTAAEATPDSVCLEVEAGSYTFAQARGERR